MFALVVLAQARFEKMTDTANQAMQLLQVVVFPLICVAVLLGVLMRTRSLAAVLGAVFPLAVGAVFVYNPNALQTVGSWFI